MKHLQKQSEVTQILNKSTRELQRSIENLLNYNSSLSVNEVKQRESLNLDKILSSVLERHALAIRNKRLSIVRDTSSAYAFVDREQIATVFDNLLSNAIKYSNADSEIHIWLQQDDKQCVFTIRDHGSGISSKNKKNIFDAFYVGQQSKHRTLKGTGLGLSIAKQYVDLHQGKIEALTTRQGAAFQVTLNR